MCSPNRGRKMDCHMEEANNPDNECNTSFMIFNPNNRQTPVENNSRVSNRHGGQRSVRKDLHRCQEDDTECCPSLNTDELANLSISSEIMKSPNSHSSPAAAINELPKVIRDEPFRHERQRSKKLGSANCALNANSKSCSPDEIHRSRGDSARYYIPDDRKPRKTSWSLHRSEMMPPPYERHKQCSDRPMSYNKRMLTLILGHVTTIIIMMAVILLLVMAGLGFLAWKVMMFTGPNVLTRSGGDPGPNCHAGIPVTVDSSTAVDCYDLLLMGNRKSGVYQIRPNHNINVTSVYCDMDTDGGGWTVLLRRMDNSENFLRKWNAYRNGFGKLGREFWAGNELMHQMTSGKRKYVFRVDMTRFDGFSQYAEYSLFTVAPESDYYRLYVSGYSGTAGDSFTYHNACRFSTPEIDNDFSRDNCARTSGGAWWFRGCHHVLLTGPYGSYPAVDKGRGISWRVPWATRVYLKFVEMKIRPNNKTSSSMCL